MCKQFTKLLALFVCLGLLLGLSGCTDPDANAVAGSDTATTTTATTTTVATTTTTEAPTTTTTAAPVPEEPIVAGGTAFRLGDRTFHLGDDATELLAFLGEPLKTMGPGGNPVYDGFDMSYYYPHISFTTFRPTNQNIEFIHQVYFTDDYYNLNGVSLGSSAQEFASVFPNYEDLGEVSAEDNSGLFTIDPYYPNLVDQYEHVWCYVYRGENALWCIDFDMDKTAALRVKLQYTFGKDFYYND